MICIHCRKESNPASRVCPYCGRFMGEEAALIIQGDAVPVYDDSDYRPQDRRPPGRAPGADKRAAKRRRRRTAKPGRKRDGYRRVMINWAMIGLVAVILLFVLGLGSYVYLKMTPNGQLILARMGREASADAYWTLGTEYLDQGYVARSVSTYEKALGMQPEHPELVDRLMLLGEAYEVASQPDKAEEVYTRIYEELQPAQPLGYRNVIRLMLQQERISEAVALMKVAAEKTKDDSFTAQRASYVPLPPTATVAAGRYLIRQTVEFVSPQGYDIYYATGNELLPEGGTLYTEPINLGEGSHSFRAVCVSSLVSDEMNIKYVVTLPQPPAPKANLAAGTYEGQRSVKLRDMETDKKDPKKQNTMYYTIDGTTPTVDSPRYVGEAIKLAGGRTVLRAIAVNGYGKVSNELNIGFTIKNVRFKDYFNGDDDFKSLPMMKITYEDFVKAQGEPQSSAPIDDDAVAGESFVARYRWGEARFVSLDIGRVLYHLDTDDPGMSGPRGSKVGMDMTEVTAMFRDMGQLPNERGDRGIYYDITNGYANYKAESDDPTTGRLLYVATVYGESVSTRILIFTIRAGHVERIQMRYVDRKVSNVL